MIIEHDHSNQDIIKLKNKNKLDYPSLKKELKKNELKMKCKIESEITLNKELQDKIAKMQNELNNTKKNNRNVITDYENELKKLRSVKSNSENVHAKEIKE